MSNKLMCIVDDLLFLSDKLEEDIYRLYILNREKLAEDKYDLSVINNDGYLSRHRREEYLKIFLMSKDSMDAVKLEKILFLRCKMLESSIANLSINNIGTAMNKSRELIHDIRIDFERCKTR